MTSDSVPSPVDRSSSRTRVLYVALPLLTLSWLVLLSVLAMSVTRIQRWEVAPGEAARVASRISFAAIKGETAPPKRYRSTNSIRFVTAQTGQLTALDSLLAWIDPHVIVDTYREHFGTQTPSSVRRLGYQSMFGAKQIAEYVALKKLGMKAEFHEGAVLIEQTICVENSAPKSACKVLDVGEVITSVDGEKTPTLTELVAELKDRKVGDVVTLMVIPYSMHGQKAKQAEKRTVELMESPDTPGKTIIGFSPADTRTVELPFNVNIATADIGGPSGGLAFTLALIDELTAGNLMGETQVAATGTMNEAGQVGAIGALEQKAIAVRDSGAKLFLVPAGQSKDEMSRARKAAGTGVKIVQVATLDDALRVLAAQGGAPLPSATGSTAK